MLKPVTKKLLPQRGGASIHRPVVSVTRVWRPLPNPATRWNSAGCRPNAVSAESRTCWIKLIEELSKVTRLFKVAAGVRNPPGGNQLLGAVRPDPKAVSAFGLLAGYEGPLGSTRFRQRHRLFRGAHGKSVASESMDRG